MIGTPVMTRAVPLHGYRYVAIASDELTIELALPPIHAICHGIIRSPGEPEYGGFGGRDAYRIGNDGTHGVLTFYS